MRPTAAVLTPPLFGDIEASGLSGFAATLLMAGGLMSQTPAPAVPFVVPVKTAEDTLPAPSAQHTPAPISSSAPTPIPEFVQPGIVPAQLAQQTPAPASSSVPTLVAQFVRPAPVPTHLVQQTSVPVAPSEPLTAGDSAPAELAPVPARAARQIPLPEVPSALSGVDVSSPFVLVQPLCATAVQPRHSSTSAYAAPPSATAAALPTGQPSTAAAPPDPSSVPSPPISLKEAPADIPAPTPSSPVLPDLPVPAHTHRELKIATPVKQKNRSDMSVPVSVTASPAPAEPLHILPFLQRTEEDSDRMATPRPISLQSSTPLAPERTAGPSPEPPPAKTSGDLAFAVKVQPAPPASPTPKQFETATAPPVLSRKAAEIERAPATEAPSISYPQPTAHSETPTTTPASSAAPLKPAEAVWSPKPESKPVVAPLKDISLQVAQPGSQKVEVRVVQQSGELRVAVHTRDSDLSQGLQEGLSDLVGRLQQNGFHGEAWHPAGSTVHATPALETHNAQNASQDGSSRQSSGGSQQQDSGRRQNQSRPEWVEELENSFDTNEQMQGVSYGITS